MVIRKIFEIFLLIVIAEGCCFVADYSEDIRTVYVDLGQNITLPCDESSEEGSSLNVNSVMWIRKEKEEKQNSRLQIISNGSLFLEKLVRNDTGEYLCTLDDSDDSSVENDNINGRELVEENYRSRYRLIVRSPPPPLVNVSVHPTAVLALLLWEVGDNGGSDITHFSARYRLKHDPKDDWHDVLPKHISPTARQIDVYHLNPNSTYTFQIWAINHLGDGEKTEIDGTTTHDSEEIELARHLLEGAENFDTRVWVVAVAVVMGTLVVLSIGTCYLLSKEYNMPTGDDQEIIELVPNIILNPGFYDADLRADGLYQLDENFNDQTPIRLNNNSVLQPIRL